MTTDETGHPMTTPSNVSTPASTAISPSSVGAFVQLIEFHTEHPEQLQPILQQWLTAIGAHRTARWYITAADRDHPGTYMQLVEFPSHAAAAANSDHPATTRFATDLRALCPHDLVFRNLDVTTAAQL